MKTKIKLRAIKLRQEGKSLLEISRICNISKSTASVWLRGLKLGAGAVKILQEKGGDNWRDGLKAKSAKRKKVISYIDLENRAYLIKNKITYKNSFLLCSLLYWCEGVKVGSTVNFVNSDPKLVSLFMKLFRLSFPLDETKFRVCLHLHSYHRELTQKRFWARIIGVPISQFNKSFIKHNSGKNIRKNYPGCVSIRYSDYKIFNKIINLTGHIG